MVPSVRVVVVFGSGIGRVGMGRAEISSPSCTFCPGRNCFRWAWNCPSHWVQSPVLYIQANNLLGTKNKQTEQQQRKNPKTSLGSWKTLLFSIQVGQWGRNTTIKSWGQTSLSFGLASSRVLPSLSPDTTVRAPVILVIGISASTDILDFLTCL